MRHLTNDQLFSAFLERVKGSRSLDQDVFETLDKMEALQSTVNVCKAFVKRKWYKLCFADFKN